VAKRNEINVYKNLSASIAFKAINYGVELN